MKKYEVTISDGTGVILRKTQTAQTAHQAASIVRSFYGKGGEKITARAGHQ